MVDKRIAMFCPTQSLIKCVLNILIDLEYSTFMLLEYVIGVEYSHSFVTMFIQTLP